MVGVLDGHVAVVTGAGNGLGAAVARLFASLGSAVVLVARGPERLAAVAAEITAAGGVAVPIAGDIASADDTRALIAGAVARFGGIDTVINIAGSVAGVGKRTWELSEADWAALSATNITGPFLLAHAAVPVMLAQGVGRLLMLTSSSGEMAMPTACGYGASKAAVNQMVRAMALELAGSGVTVNAFNPGPVATPTLDHVYDNLQIGPFRNSWAGMTRPPEEAARMVLWLCSPEAAALSGEIIDWRDPRVAQGVAALREIL